MTGEYDPTDDDSQTMEMSGPDTRGFYSSNLLDWVPLCPQLKDSAVRLYWIMRALVIEKHGPVRKLTLLQLCYLLPAKPAAPGEPVKPSSLARIRSLLSELTAVGLVTTPDGKRIKTSSRATASAGALRLRINDRPFPGYTGPRNAFAALDSVRPAAADAAEKAIRAEAAREAARKASRAAEEAGQKASPQTGAGQISSPAGQISSPAGQISSPDSRADLQDHEPPLSPPAQSSRSAPTSVRPSVSVSGGVREDGTDGGTDGGGVIEGQEQPSAGGDAVPAAAGAAPEKDAATGAVGAPAGGPARQAETHPGVMILARVGTQVPKLKLGGKVLLDQGRRVHELLASGWAPLDLIEALSAPFGDEIRTSAGAVMSARISALPLSPSSAVGQVPKQAPGTDPAAAAGVSWTERQKELAAATTRRGLNPCCTGDDGMCDRLSESGHDLCAQHLGWPLCDGGCGLRVPTGSGDRCDACDRIDMAEIYRAAETAAAKEETDCPGHSGPCGRPAQGGGLCARCRIAAEEARRAARDADWEAEVARAVAATEADQDEHAPF